MVIEAVLWSSGIVGGMTGSFVLLNHLGNKRLKNKAENNQTPQPQKTTKVKNEEKFDFIHIGNTINPKLMPTQKGTFTRNQISYERLVQLSNNFLENMKSWQGFLIKGEFDENTNVKIMSLGHGKYLHIKYACNNGILLYCDINDVNVSDKIVITINDRVYTCDLYDYWRIVGLHEVKIKHTKSSLISDYGKNYHVQSNIRREMKSTYDENNTWSRLISNQPTTPVNKGYVPKSSEMVEMLDDFYSQRSDSSSYSDSSSSYSYKSSDEYKTERLFDDNEQWLKATHERLNRNKSKNLHNSLDGFDSDYELSRLFD